MDVEELLELEVVYETKVFKIPENKATISINQEC